MQKGSQVLFKGRVLDKADTFADLGISHTDMLFVVQGRAETKVWYRFKKDYSSSWYVNNDAWDAINFKVSSPIELVGFMSFGPMQRKDFGITYKCAINDNFFENVVAEFSAGDLIDYG